MEPTTNNNTDLRWEEVPKRYPLCFNIHCNKRDDCLHYLAGTVMPKNVLSGPAVYPTAQNGNECIEYQKAERIRMACGFKHIMSLVRCADEQNIHIKLYSVMGSHQTYYRCNRGEYFIPPERQEAVLNVLRSYGYTEDLHFDGYREAWNFS